MKKTSLIIISSMMLFNCENSPSKLLNKGDNYLADSELQKAEEAYQKIIENFPEDSLAQTGLYKIAWVELDKKNNYDKGFDLLNQCAEITLNAQISKTANDDVQNFPNWLVYKASQFRKDSLYAEAIRTIDHLTNKFVDAPILAEALYLKGNIYLNDKKEFYRAINTYQEIIHKYKGSSFEPMSQFMIGYIHANVQVDLQKAKAAYKKFLENYSEHELAPSVQFELEYLGKQIKNIDELSLRND